MRFCELISDADEMTIEKAIKQMGWSPKLYRQMRHEQPAFDMAVARAREMAQDAWVDKMPEIVRTEEDVQRARLMCDNIKWTAARIKPKTYGDKLDLNVHQVIDIGGALAEARNRAVVRPRCDPTDIIDVQVVDVTEQKSSGSADKQSVAQSLPDIFD